VGETVCDVVVELSLVHADGDLQIDLLSPTDTVIGSSTGVTDVERITAANQSAVGTYLVRVRGADLGAEQTFGPLQLDYKFDDSLSWSGYNNIYGRSDHYNYAKAGVPIAFFFTGLHGDYHQKTDEPEFIDYPHYAKITNYVEKLVEEVGNGPRPRMNGSKPAKPVKPTVP
jgi:hypothetical protein